MIPRLPPEVIARIQVVAEWGEDQEEVKQLRTTFSLVNKQWSALVDHWSRVLVLSRSDLARLAKLINERSVLAGAKARARSIEVNLSQLDKVALISALAKLVKPLSGCTSITLTGESGFSSFGWGPTGDQSRSQLPPARELFEAITSLPHIRHFEYAGLLGPSGECDSAAISQDHIHW